ncbi:MAG: M28 family peptidase [Balneolaceae bacterium]
MINRRIFSIFLALFLWIGSAACNSQQPDTATIAPVDADELLADLAFLSSDELEGRRTGTEGNRIAREYIEARFMDLQLQPVGDSYRQPFTHTNRRSGETFDNAINIIGTIEGTEHPNRYIAVIAHYDHLGVQNGEIYNGTDDNASGTSGLMAIARYFSANPPANSLLFIALDAEEQGLGGAWHYVENPLIPLEQTTMVVNMDMISNNDEDELYAVGTHHYPFLKPMIEEATSDASISVLFGFDSEEWPQDWTMSSDHGPFHQKGVPFIYFGVEDHAHYHSPSDTFENTNHDFFVHAVETILGAVTFLDNHLDQVESHR